MVKSLIGRQFSGVKEMPASAAKIAKAQPGYRPGHTLMFAKTSSGGVRLYVAVSGQWMDGSLEDIPDGGPLQGAEKRGQPRKAVTRPRIGPFTVDPSTAAALEADRRDGESKGAVIDRWAADRKK